MKPRTVKLEDIRHIPDMKIGDEDSWQPINLAELDDQPPVQPTLGGTGLVYPGKRHVFSGPQESAKTLAAYAIALQVIRTDGIVVIIDFEMGRWDARNRLRELGANPEELSHVAYVDPSEPASSDRIERLVLLYPQLVIIDAAAGAYDNLSLDDNKRTDVERFTRIYIRQFWQAGIASIVLDHVVKNVDGRGNYAIGSERKVGGTDVHLGFTVIAPIKRGATGIYKITTHKDRGGYLQRGHIADLHLSSDPETHQISWELKPVEHHQDEDEFRPTVLMERVSRWLEQEGGAHSGNKIEKAVEGKNDYIRQAIKCLVAETFVGKTETGRGYEYAHISSYRASDDFAPADPSIQAENDFAPTSPHLAPDEVYTTSPLAPPLYKGGEVEGEGRNDEIDVFDPAIQALLDDPDKRDSDIPF